MYTFLARQPIFNQHKRLFAYELLYRGSDDATLDQISGNKATSAVLTSAFFTEGLDKLTGNKPCFVNFTEELLLHDIVLNFPATRIVVEIPKSVQPTQAMIDTCKELKEKGYILALDDFVYHQKLTPLIELADIIKFDLQSTSLDDIRNAFKFLKQYDIEFLAEKVETSQAFDKALKLGFSYFQGFFFATPEKIRIKELAAGKVNLLRLLAEVNNQDVDQEKLVDLISSDVALSYKFLRYINSSYFYRISKIESINHAVAFLGEREVKRFVSLLLISEIATEKPTELVRLALSRARFCELLAEESCTLPTSEIFLLGLFSLLDAMLDMSMENAIKRLPLDDFLKQAITLHEGPYAPFLNAVLAYERKERDNCLEAINLLGVNREQIYPMYLTSLEYADSLTGT